MFPHPYQIEHSTSCSRSSCSVCGLVRRERWRRCTTFRAMMPVASARKIINATGYNIRANGGTACSFRLIYLEPLPGFRTQLPWNIRSYRLVVPLDQPKGFSHEVRRNCRARCNRALRRPCTRARGAKRPRFGPWRSGGKLGKPFDRAKLGRDYGQFLSERQWHLELGRERCQRRRRPRQDAELQSQRHAATGPA
jgi:hypothetical protein